MLEHEASNTTGAPVALDEDPEPDVIIASDGTVLFDGGSPDIHGDRAIGPFIVNRQPRPALLNGFSDLIGRLPCINSPPPACAQATPARQCVRRVEPPISLYDVLSHESRRFPSGPVLQRCVEIFLASMRACFPHAAGRPWVQLAALLSHCYAIMVFSWNHPDGYLICPTLMAGGCRRKVLPLDCHGVVHLLTESTWWHLNDAVVTLAEPVPQPPVSQLIYCPWCDFVGELHRRDINCGVLRCGTDAQGRQLPPHASETEVLRLRNRMSPAVQGCGRQFRVESIGGCLHTTQIHGPTV
jgi:hypothetical protein